MFYVAAVHSPATCVPASGEWTLFVLRKNVVIM